MNIKIKNTSEEYSVSKIFCIGRNYAKHAKELGNAVPEKPVVFMKSKNALLADGNPIPFPAHGSELHHEAELVILIGKAGKNIPENEAASYVAGYGIGLDLTLRDVQSNQKTKGLPWEIAKAFDGSAPLGTFVKSVSDERNISIKCFVNNELRQDGNTQDMIYSIPYLIHYLSGIFSLEKGDIIYTGTPDGVGPLNRGDSVRVEISGVGEISFNVG